MTRTVLALFALASLTFAASACWSKDDCNRYPWVGPGIPTECPASSSTGKPKPPASAVPEGGAVGMR